MQLKISFLGLKPTQNYSIYKKVHFTLGCDVPCYQERGQVCRLTVEEAMAPGGDGSGCVDWNRYYTTCTIGPTNPFHGAVSFDNIGLAWVAIFLVISLEGWTDVMYFVQDSHSFWNWIYFVFLIVVGPHFILPLSTCIMGLRY